jgi:hypothetical protein
LGESSSAALSPARPLPTMRTSKDKELEVVMSGRKKAGQTP